jgi:hypothetical protein
MGKAQGLLESGDVAGLLRYLRADGDALPLGEVAALMAERAGSPVSTTWRRRRRGSRRRVRSQCR